MISTILLYYNRLRCDVRSEKWMEWERQGYLYLVFRFVFAGIESDGNCEVLRVCCGEHTTKREALETQGGV